MPHYFHFGAREAWVAVEPLPDPLHLLTVVSFTIEKLKVFQVSKSKLCQVLSLKELNRKMSRNASSVALQSLTATYTDSEGEEDDHRFRKRSNSPGHEDEDGDIKTTDLEKDSQVLTSTNSPESNKSGTNTPQSGSSVCGK